jgi:peptide/nickel transport system substrate-binding protein
VTRRGARIPRRTWLVASAAATAAALLETTGSALARPTALRSLGALRHLPDRQSSVATGALPVPRDEAVVQEQVQYTVFDSFNPFTPNGNEWPSGWLQICNEPFFYANVAAGKVVPWLATDFRLSPDYMTGYLTLRQGVTWNDGHPFTSEDVVFTFNMYLEHPEVFGTTWGQQLKSVEAKGDYQVVFHFATPQPRWQENVLETVVTPPAVVVPAHVWKGKDPATFSNNPPVTTGAWMLGAVYPDLKMFVWKRNENYWGKKVLGLFPKPKYVVYRSAPPADEDAVDFRRGVIDWAGGLQYPEMQLLKASMPSADLITAFTDPCPRGCYFNCAKPPFSIREFRYAISYLIDRETAAKVIWSPPTEPVQFPWSSWKWFAPYENPDAQAIVRKYNFGYDPKKAAALLDSIGIRMGPGGKRLFRGKPLSFEIITPVPTSPPGAEYLIAQMIAKECARLGIDVTVASYSVGPTFGNDTATGNFDMTSHWLCGAFLDPVQLYDAFNGQGMTPLGQRALTADWPRLDDPTYNKLDDALDKVPPGPAAMSLYNEMLDRYFYDLPAVPTIQTVYPFLLSTSVWTGWPTNSNLYTVPDNWWSPSALIYFHLQRAR